MQARAVVVSELNGPLGKMVAGATPKGVCYLNWPETERTPDIAMQITRRYQMPLRPGSNRHLKKLEKELVAYFMGTLTRFQVALDAAGTPFEQSVWDRLLKIPYGETRSYGQVAASLGRPKAARAVGRANGSNPIAIVVPCHRVIGANGTLRGYGGELWRKKRLLDLEAGLQQ